MEIFQIHHHMILIIILWKIRFEYIYLFLFVNKYSSIHFHYLSNKIWRIHYIYDSGDERELSAIQRLVVDEDQAVPVLDFLDCPVARSTFVNVDVLRSNTKQHQQRRILAQRSSLCYQRVFLLFFFNGKVIDTIVQFKTDALSIKVRNFI